jgi:molybdopterin-biosynthesis enzyme MoeA-like protein
LKRAVRIRRDDAKGQDVSGGIGETHQDLVVRCPAGTADGHRLARQNPVWLNLDSAFRSRQRRQIERGDESDRHPDNDRAIASDSETGY